MLLRLMLADSGDNIEGFYYTTICSRSSDPFYIVTQYIEWVTTSWTHSIAYKQYEVEMIIR